MGGGSLEPRFIFMKHLCRWTPGEAEGYGEEEERL